MSREPLELVVAYRTDPGRVRETNQDWAEIFWADDADEAAHKGNLFLVADGMGGHASGEAASKFAVQKVAYEYRRDPAADPKVSLERAIIQANAEIFHEAAAQVGTAGAGTTLVGLVVRSGQAVIANVGDSRAYRVRAGRMRKMTRDHSWVEEQTRSGTLTEHQAKQHELRSTITRAVGIERVVTPDLFERTIQAGDIFVLCTDGLTKHVSDAQIQAIVTQYAPEEAADHLVRLARRAGGTDNVTVMIVQARRPAIAGFRISELFSPAWWTRRRPARFLSEAKETGGRLAQSLRPPADRPTMVAETTPSTPAGDFRISELFSLSWWTRRRLAWSIPVLIGVLALSLLVLVLAGWALRSWIAGPKPLVALPVQPAPIRYRILQDMLLSDLADRFGYASVSEFERSSQAISSPGGAFDQEHVSQGVEFLVEPARPYYFVGGRFNERIDGPNGTTGLELATEQGRYRVSIPQAELQRSERFALGKEDLLWVFGEQPSSPDGQPSPNALLIQRVDVKESRWVTWYASPDLPRGIKVWVYGNLAETGFGPEIARARIPSDFVAAYGAWVPLDAANALTFRWDEVYTLDEGSRAYILARRASEGERGTPTVEPTRAPTATLRPSTSND